MTIRSLRTQVRRLAAGVQCCPHCRRPLDAAATEKPQQELDWNTATVDELRWLRDFHDRNAASLRFVANDAHHSPHCDRSPVIDWSQVPLADRIALLDLCDAIIERTRSRQTAVA